jgi:ubiquinone/menaquinone biosynthesis C-methylase UbiE
MNTQKPEDLYQARREFFNERAERWLDLCYLDPDTGQHTLHDPQFARLFKEITLPKDGVVLDVGCGSGVLVPHILPLLSPKAQLIELDYAEKMIAENRRLHTDPRLRFMVSDVLAVGLPPASVDLVLCFSCFPHFEDKPAVVKALAALLPQGGQFVIAHFNSAHELNNHHRKFGPVQHDMLPDEKAMRAMVADAGLKLDSFTDESGFYLLKAWK